MELEDSNAELELRREETFERLTTEAANYRLLIDKCTFQPSCPEWLEDVGTGIANAATKTGEAISNAAEWCWDGVNSAADWVASGGIEDTVKKVGGFVDDNLAFMSDLQTKLNSYIGFEGLCSLNPFGGTLGCANCPMGSKCTSNKDSILDKLKLTTSVNDFLKNLKGALGLNNGQLLGNLLQCAAALTGQVSGAIAAVETFSIGTGAAKVLGNTTNILNTGKLPNWNTKVADCISCGNSLGQAKDALALINKTGKSPVDVLSSKAPGLNASVIDIKKIGQLETGSTHFTSLALGEKNSVIKSASSYLPVENVKGFTKYSDGKNVDIDSASKQMKQMKAVGIV
jgi:hypothetical protein